MVHLIRQGHPLGCLKVRPTHRPLAKDERTPTTDGAYWMEDATYLQQPGADCGRYFQAGAAQVEVLRHHGNGLAAGLPVALERFPAGLPIVVESSGAVPHLRPVAVILIVRPPPREMKPSTLAILPQVTDLLINTSDDAPSSDRAAAALGVDFPALRPQFTWSANLALEPPPQPLLDRLITLLHATIP
ncbi:MAG: hypothetical protein KJ749_12225 [Planctomycetes bacterium]|nr:hypothetical protein [Planctomycetota bacterium]